MAKGALRPEDAAVRFTGATLTTNTLFFFHLQAARLQAALERSARNLQASRKEKLGDHSLTPGSRP